MRLKTKLVIAFVMVAFLATLLANGMASWAVERAFNQYIFQHQSTRLNQWDNILSGYYRQNGSWEGVENLATTTPNRGNYGQGQGRNGLGPMQARERILLADLSGSIIMDSYAQALGRPLSEITGEKGQNIIIQGQPVARLVLTLEPTPGLTSLEDIFSTTVNKAIIYSGVFAIFLAASLGIYFAIRLTQPIKRLQSAATQLAQGNLQEQLDVSTDDEIGELSKAFKDMAQSISENEHLRQSLVADVAHELRTPLSILRGNFELILSGVIEPTEETIASLHDEVLRMSYLVKDLQELSLAEAGQLRLDLAEVNLIELLTNIMSKLSLEAVDENITMNHDFSSEKLMLTLDIHRIGQVFFNLMGNAIRYTPPNGEITVSAAQINSYAQITISDTGPGIPQDDLPYIFERFYRGDKARVRSDSGAGLGLAIAKGFIEAHGGSISANNISKGGSTFTVLLPLPAVKDSN